MVAASHIGTFCFLLVDWLGELYLFGFYALSGGKGKMTDYLVHQIGCG